MLLNESRNEFHAVAFPVHPIYKRNFAVNVFRAYFVILVTSNKTMVLHYMKVYMYTEC